MRPHDAADVLVAVEYVTIIVRPLAAQSAIGGAFKGEHGQISGSTNFLCTRDNVYSLCARKNHHPRGWRLSEVRKSEPNGARGL
jgi:hypothetical protein